MKRSIFLKSFRVDRILEEGCVSFVAKCPIPDCTHEAFHNVHYGDEHGAHLAAESDIFIHCRLIHKMSIEDEPTSGSSDSFD